MTTLFQGWRFDDFDQDGDGSRSQLHGRGSDCDDLDPNINLNGVEAINGHHPSRPQPIRKASSWAVAAGGVQNIGSMIPEKDNLDCNEPNFYLMKSSDSSDSYL